MAICKDTQTINEAEFLGPSLFIINNNNNNLDTSLCGLYSSLTGLSAFTKSLSVKDSFTIDASFSPSTYTLSANVINNSLGTVRLGQDIIDVTKIFLRSAKLSAIADANLSRPKLNDLLTWSSSLNKWIPTPEIDLVGAKQLSAMEDVRIDGSTVKDGHVLRYNSNLWYNTPEALLTAVRDGNYSHLSATSNGLKWNITSSAVDTLQLSPFSVTSAKLSNNSVTTIKIENADVTRDKIADGAVNTDKLANDAVINRTILNSTISSSKLTDFNRNLSTAGVVERNILNRNVSAVHLAVNSVTTSKISAEAITQTKLATDSVTTRAIASQQVDTDQFAPSSVTDIKIAAEAVTNNKIKIKDPANGYLGLTEDKFAFIPGEINVGNNINTAGVGVYFGENDSQKRLPFYSLRNAGGVQITRVLTSDVTTDEPIDTIHLYANQPPPPAPPIGSNLGFNASNNKAIFARVLSTPTLNQYQFKKLVPGDFIDIQETSNEITISRVQPQLATTLLVNSDITEQGVVDLLTSIFPLDDSSRIPLNTECRVKLHLFSGTSSSSTIPVTIPFTMAHYSKRTTVKKSSIVAAIESATYLSFKFTPPPNPPDFSTDNDQKIANTKKRDIEVITANWKYYANLNNSFSSGLLIGDEIIPPSNEPVIRLYKNIDKAWVKQV